MPPNPITPFILRHGALILDGGLATELERRGANLADELWSARLLRDDPNLIREVHAEYYRAGADCGTSASYQATVPGFMKRGMSEADAIALLRLSVDLVIEARDEFWATTTERESRLRPLVAASVGPYAAYLADASEYTGVYDLDEEGLLAFHRQRWHLLAGSGADLLACETIPNSAEARALARLLPEAPDTYAWFSFACRDGAHISDGTPIAACAAALDPFEQVAAIGINCTAPRYIPDLIREVRRATSKPIIVYPNSGEQYSAAEKRWQGESVPLEFGARGREWRDLGASLVGGCCRTGPDHIRQISEQLRGKPWPA